MLNLELNNKSLPTRGKITKVLKFKTVNDPELVQLWILEEKLLPQFTKPGNTSLQSN